MIEQLVSLLLPIDALLGHTAYHPGNTATPEMTAQFRDMWFLCTLFDFYASDEKGVSATDWRRPALSRIAVKAPALVSEEAHESLASDIEYSNVLRQDYARTVRRSIVWCIDYH